MVKMLVEEQGDVEGRVEGEQEEDGWLVDWEWYEVGAE